MRSLSWFTALCFPSLLAAQEMPVRQLGPLVGRTLGPYLEVRGVRELSDERVMVLDRTDRKLYMVSFRSGASIQVGRDGEGPGEYRVPLWMLALPADTTVVYDMFNPYRFLVYGPDGKPARTIPIRDPGTSGPPDGVDAVGRLYIAERGVRGLTKRFGKIVRIDRASGQRDSLAVVNYQVFPPMRISSRPSPLPPFATYEQWAAAPDGRVVILHPVPYRVTLVLPDRSVIEGPPLPAEPVRVSKEHKAEWLENRMQPRIGIYRINGVTSYFQRPRREELEEPTFPPYLPAFLLDALWVASDGMIWVKRTTAFGAPPTFDLLDRQGQLAARVQLPAGTRLVGFGAGTVYLARQSDQEMDFLERYRLP